MDGSISSSDQVVISDINLVKDVLLKEYRFFAENKDLIFAEPLPNSFALTTSFNMLENSANADLTVLENIVQLDIVIERLNTRIAMSYLNLVEEHEVVLKFITRVPNMLFKLHINKLRILKKLVLNGRYCSIIHISSEIGTLIDLKELDISGYVMTHLPEAINHLQNLEILKIRHNHITCLPEDLEALSQLKELDVSHNRELKILPRGIGKLKNLKKLAIDHDDLGSLPEELGNLTGLREIIADHNHITKLPKSFENLKELAVLDMHNNQLSKFPEKIKKLPALEYVNLSGNLVKNLEQDDKKSQTDK